MTAAHDLKMDDYIDPYEAEAETEAAAEATGLGPPTAEEDESSDSDDSDEEDNSKAKSDYEEKSYGLLRSRNHRVRNPDDTFRYTLPPRQEEVGLQAQGSPSAR
uniref:Uncharacterized protein n=1 Tax=Leersia perrieri TaxID=77586 RepID=A0A0D9UWQ2_9ORYZ